MYRLYYTRIHNIIIIYTSCTHHTLYILPNIVLILPHGAKCPPTLSFVSFRHTHTHTTIDIHVYNINAFTFGLSPLFRTLARSLSHYTSSVAVFINGRTLLLHFDNRILCIYIYIYDIFPTISLWAYTCIYGPFRPAQVPSYICIL